MNTELMHSIYLILTVAAICTPFVIVMSMVAQELSNVINEIKKLEIELNFKHFMQYIN